MKTIQLQDEFQVKSLLLSIATNVVEWKKMENELQSAKHIIKDLLKMAISIEEQTNVKTYENVSISSVFALELI
jgi:hypothetical protein